MVPRSAVQALEGCHGEGREGEEEQGIGTGKAEDLVCGKGKICCDNLG